MRKGLFLYFSVGKNISTLALGSDEREDITKYYKPPEGKKIM